MRQRADETPTWSKMRLDITLSIAIAEPITPLPVYGMRRISRSPCTQPSSPHTPCSATNATSTPFCCNAAGSGSPSFQSMPTACQPRPRSDSSTPFPVRRLTSRSDEGPPMITPILRCINSLLRCSMRLSLFSHHFDFQLQLDAEPLAHRAAHLVDQRQHVARAGG